MEKKFKKLNGNKAQTVKLFKTKTKSAKLYKKLKLDKKTSKLSKNGADTVKFHKVKIKFVQFFQAAQNFKKI